MHNATMRYFLLALFLAFPADPHWWSVQTSGIDTNLRGVTIFAPQDAKANNSPIVWASGSNGVVLRSTDEGKTWKSLHVSGGEKLDFRGIQAVTADTAYLMSIGDGENSRIYKTTDGGATWTLQYTGNHPTLFLDALACLSPTHCFAISDPVDGKFLLLSTEDGAHWKELPSDHMPAAFPNEGIFAASNSALLLDPATGEILFATGGPAARLFRSTDLGYTWTVSETPITHANASSGIFSIYREGQTIVAVGGDYKSPDSNTAVSAYSLDNGLTWHLSATQPGGFRSAVASFGNHGIAAVGPSGTDVSFDHGIHWQPTDTINLNALAFDVKLRAGWAVGSKGTIARFMNHSPSRLPITSSAPGN